MPWAKGHSWQSWRERYKKNQDWYNHQIKKYQKKLRVCGTHSTTYLPLLRQLAKHEAAATHKRSEKSEKAPKKPEESEQTSVNESKVREDLYTELFGISQSLEEDEDESDRSPQQIHNKPKKIVPRDDDNFFGTPSPSPSLLATNSAAKRKLPILLEGPYRNSLKRSRTASGDDESWPPKRRKKMVDDVDVSPDVDMLDAHGKVETKSANRRSCNLSSHTSTISASDHSIPSFLPEDRELINGVGFAHVMATIAKHYGFDEDVAKRAFYKTNSIEKTKGLLQRCNKVLCDMLARRDDVDSSGDEAPQSMRRGHSSSRKNSNESNSGSLKAKSSSSSRRAIWPSLRFKPRPFDEKIDIALSEYSPPHISRAGQFNRLVKQGRREEAIDRERRRASGIFIAQTQTQSYDEAQRQQSLSPLPNTSPLQSEPMDIDGCDDVRSLVIAPHEDTVQHQPPDDTPSPVDHHRIFFKRISEGQSTLNEDEDDPAMLKLAQEHRNLVMDVTEENAERLRCFEQKNNQDLLRLWSLDWARQKIADM
jgi:hypothetical protein